MDPIRQLLDRLTAVLPGPNPALKSALDDQLRTFFAKFELVPRHEYLAHIEVLKTLENQVSELEARLAELEEKED